MQQLVNSLCVVCLKRIGSIVEGRFCERCGSPVHKNCVQSQANSNPESGCSVCGSDRPELPIPLHKEKVPGDLRGETSLFSPGKCGPADDDWSLTKSAPYGRRIIQASVASGVLGVLFGLAFLVMLIGEADTVRRLKAAIFAPILFGLTGGLLGSCMACVFAPRNFLTGPAGRYWMKRIGTGNPTVARVVCLILGLLVAGFFALLGWMLWQLSST
jgi:hypothetical protein